MKTLADFADLPDLDKLILVDIQPAMQLNEQTWTQDGGNNNWYYDVPAAVAQYGEIVKVEEDGVEYDEEFSASLCHGNSSSFYYDDINQRLHVHTSGSDDPASETGGEPDYSIVAFFWKGFANRPKIIERYEQQLVNNKFNFWTSSTDIESVTESISGSSTITRTTTVYDDSIHLYSAKITIDGSANAAYFYWAFSTKPKRKCKARVLYKTTAGETASLVIRDSGSNVYLNSSGQWSTSWAVNTLAASTDWTWFEIEFVAHSGYSNYHFMIHSVDANAEVWVQECELFRYYQPGYFKPLLPAELPSIQQSVGTYVFPEAQISIGDITINNDGWWWDVKQGDVYLWHNKRVTVRGGSDSWDYDDMPFFFYGLARIPAAKKGEVRFQAVDDRMNLKRIPTDKLTVAAYPNVHGDWQDKPAPILLGGGASGHIFKPPEVNTSNYTYLISDTSHGGATYPVYVLSNVWKAGVLQTVTTHYTVNLSAGTFTMNSDPGSDEITCNAQGLEDISPFVTGGSIAFKAADFLYFILVVLNGVDKHRLNMAALKDLWDNRVMAAQEYITDEDTIDIINRMQRTSWFQFFPRLDGTLEARRYRSDVPDDVLRLYDYDFVDWELVEDTNHSYHELVIKNKPNFATGVYQEEDQDGGTENFDTILWEHGTRERLILDTNLETDVETQNLIDNLYSMMEDPVKVLKGTVKNHGALALNPTDKLKVTLTGNYDGVEKTILDDETLQVEVLQKDLNSGNTYIEAFVSWSGFYWLFT